MKKSLSLLLALALFCLLCAPAVATAANSTGGTTVVSVTVDVLYTVTIPSDTAIAFNALSTSIGSVEVTEARLEPGKQITVTAATDGLLENSIDAAKTIAYTLKNGGAAFTSASFTELGAKALSVDIAQTAWNSAMAGSYSDTITFTVAYESIP